MELMSRAYAPQQEIFLFTIHYDDSKGVVMDSQYIVTDLLVKFSSQESALLHPNLSSLHSWLTSTWLNPPLIGPHQGTLVSLHQPATDSIIKVNI